MKNTTITGIIPLLLAYKDKEVKLRPSSLNRNISCKGSATLEAFFEEETSEHAALGILAHEIASSCLKHNISCEFGKYYETSDGKDSYIKESETCSQEMLDYLTTYIDYCTNLKAHSAYDKVEHEVYVEQLGNKGTVDFWSLSKTDTMTGMQIVDIVDLKYGMSKVTANSNLQLLAYALGVGALFDYSEKLIYRLTVYQPRINNIDVWELSHLELMVWGEHMKLEGIKALEVNTNYETGDHCHFCKAKSICPKMEELYNDFLGGGLTFTKVLDDAKIVEEYIKSVRTKVYAQLMAGKEVEGYKLVAGKNKRYYNAESEKLLLDTLGDDAYSKNLIGIGELEALVKKGIVPKDILGKVLSTKADRPTIAKSTDSRREYNNLEDFEVIE